MLRIILIFHIVIFLAWPVLANNDAASPAPELPILPGNTPDMSALKSKVDALQVKAKNIEIQLPSQLNKPASDNAATGATALDPRNLTDDSEGAREAQRAVSEFSEEGACGVPIEQDHHEMEIYPTQETEQIESTFLRPDEKIYVFISSSMPTSTVRAYMSRLAAVKDAQVMAVMFGMIGGIKNKNASAEYFGKIMLVDQDCVDIPEFPCERMPLKIKIDPGIFKKYDITAVPSVVFVSGDNYWSIEGDSSLEYLLGKINIYARNSNLSKIINIIRRRNDR